MENNSVKITRALLGVSDKTGLADLARALARHGVEILSTGGTKAALESAGVHVKAVEDFTGFPEILDGRVKTLHPKIHGGILARRSEPSHQRAMAQHGLEPIDLVVVNFYPFEQTVAREGVSLADAIENIDIGGPTLVRAAAKNYADVAVVVDPADYPALMRELDENSGAISADTRWRLARKAFARVTAYDCAISNYLGAAAGSGPLGETFSLSLDRAQTLRYGENPHQTGALYGDFLKIAEQLHGRELSFNNVFDISSAVNLILEFADYREAVVAILKHNTPCGVGVAPTLKGAWDKAFATDPDSPFGGIIIANRPWDLPFAKAVDELFTEVLIGNAFAPGVLEFLRKKKNRRVMRFHPEAVRREDLDLKRIVGGLLVQTPDLSLEDPREGKVVTRRRAPTPAELRAMEFGIRVCKHIKSNAIAFVTEDRTLAVGGGATSRIDPLYAAREKAARLKVSLKDSVLVSEALFPFPDGPALAAEAGATAIAQPGGAMRDAEVIAAADAHGLAMVFTGVRHFRH